jgi:hypothetical protein
VGVHLVVFLLEAQVSTHAWILLLYVVIGVALAISVFRLGKRRRLLWTTATIAAYVLIPFGDHLAGSLYLKYLCGAESKLQIFKTVDNVPGFLSKGRPIEPSKFDPYLFVENEKEDGTVTRLTMMVDGKISRQDHVPSISRYRYRETPRTLALGVVEYERVIEDLTNSDVLASEKRFNFEGGWIWYQMFQNYGVTQSCEGTPSLQRRIPEVLKPAANTFAGQRG